MAAIVEGPRRRTHRGRGTPTGGIDLPPMPATAAGPGLRQLLVGSEGVLGVITQAALKLREGVHAAAEVVSRY